MRQGRGGSGGEMEGAQEGAQGDAVGCVQGSAGLEWFQGVRAHEQQL